MSGRLTFFDATAVDGDDEASFDGNIHVIPCFRDDPVHLSHSKCWCEPELVDWNEDTDVQVWCHRRIQ